MPLPTPKILSDYLYDIGLEYFAEKSDLLAVLYNNELISPISSHFGFNPVTKNYRKYIAPLDLIIAIKSAHHSYSKQFDDGLLYEELLPKLYLFILYQYPDALICLEKKGIDIHDNYSLKKLINTLQEKS